MDKKYKLKYYFQKFQEIFEIGHNGTHCLAESLVHFKTGQFSCMNASASRFDPTTQRTMIGNMTFNCRARIRETSCAPTL